MKRLRVDDTVVKEGGAVVNNAQSHTGGLYSRNVAPTISYSSSSLSGGALVNKEGMQSSLYSSAAPVSYASSQQNKPPPPQIQQQQQQAASSMNPMRTKGTSPPSNSNSSIQIQQQQASSQQQQSPGGSSFQRLKVEDALSYLDLVKYKFGDRPQVYNDFLDIMKEFKSQSIDTPGVIRRVSNLFNGFPDLIVGFNTFLPPGYKIEVQKNDQGYAFQVSLSVPSPTGGNALSEGGQGPQQKPATILSGHGTIHCTSNLPQQQNIISASSQQQQQQQQQQQLNASSHQVTLLQQQQHNAVAVSLAPYSNSHSHSHSSIHSSHSLAAQAAVNQAMNTQQPSETPQNQPVEFNHAINYVNKIKNRFQGQPEKYKRFLEILHTYQKEQRTLKEAPPPSGGGTGGVSGCGQQQGGGSGGGGGGINKHLTEQEVYSQVAKLFENQSDLLAEFGQFLPDATSHIQQQPNLSETLSGSGGGNIGGSGGGNVTGVCGQGGVINAQSSLNKKPAVGSNKAFHHHSSSHGHRERERSVNEHLIEHSRHTPSHTHKTSSSAAAHISSQVKRSPPYPSLIHRDAPPPKKHKMSSSSCRDVTLAEAAKYGTLNEYAFFDKVRKAVRSAEVYNNFLRCLTLFNQEIVSKSELVQLVTPFLGKYPELMRWFRDFLGQGEVEPIPYNVTRNDRPQGEHALDIDYTTQKRLGASYCVIPASQEGLRFSGRTPLCHEVLNNQWVSFPTWSEDSSFVGSRKNQYEEYMYRCEDERFELDVVIETNAATIRVLEGVQKKISRLSPEEVSRYRLDECLGGSSAVLHQRALKRIYGEKAPDIIDGLKRNPAVGVPVVLRRLKTKEEEWREAQKGFNKIWREQNEKYYLKSLDYQGINFKQNDVKMLRSKSLINEIETLYEERNESNEERSLNEPAQGPHMVFPYRDKTILDDAANLLIHHVKRQTGVQKGEKRRIKHILRQFVPDLFFHPRQQLSDDEREDDDDKDDDENSSYGNSNAHAQDSSRDGSTGGGGGKKSPGKSSPHQTRGGSNQDVDLDTNSKPSSLEIDMKIKEEDVKVPMHAQCTDPEEAYTLFMASNNWYLFLRLHAILCERLAKIYERAVIIADDESKNKTARKESTAVALRLKPKPTIDVDEYYPAFLDMVKNLLDGNMEPTAYEDTLREMFGIHAYIAFTLDKVVSYAVRQLQHCVTERTAVSCTEIFLKEQKRGGTGGACSTAHRRLHQELSYQRAVERIAQDEYCYKVYIYKKDCRMTIEMIDTENEEPKKTEDPKKWNLYKERFQSSHASNKNSSSSLNSNISLPLFLNRNLKKWEKWHQKRKNNNQKDNNKDKDKEKISNNSKNNSNSNNLLMQQQGQKNAGSGGNGGGGESSSLELLERKLNERALPERNETVHPGYDVSDDTQCSFIPNDFNYMFITNKDSYIYKRSAFARAKETHPHVTKRQSVNFRGWLKRWASINVSEAQHKQCTDWFMGRCDNVVPNRTRVHVCNDPTRTPYISYNRYHVERQSSDSSST